jgi:hypothetical protein
MSKARYSFEPRFSAQVFDGSITTACYYMRFTDLANPSWDEILLRVQSNRWGGLELMVTDFEGDRIAERIVPAFNEIEKELIKGVMGIMKAQPHLY